MSFDSRRNLEQSMLLMTVEMDNVCHLLKIRAETALTAGGSMICEMYFGHEEARGGLVW